MNQNQPGKIGRLTLVGTPLGNLDDMSFRAVKTLGEADVLLCEDTRRSSILLNHFKIERKGPTLSFHDHSGPRMLEKVRSFLNEGLHIAYCTDGGMPGVSDPGYVLVRLARSVDALISVVPGPSAATTFFAVCGLPSPKFLFHGFFPRTRGEIEKVISQLKEWNMTHIFYEAPFRVQETLDVLARNLPDVQMAFGRELTKIHEEIITGTATELSARFALLEKVRGECVFAVVGGDSSAAAVAAREAQMAAEQREPAAMLDPFEPDPAPEALQLTAEQQSELTELLQAGLGSKEVAKLLSKKFNLPRRAIYDFIVKHLT